MPKTLWKTQFFWFSETSLWIRKSCEILDFQTSFLWRNCHIKSADTINHIRVNLNMKPNNSHFHLWNLVFLWRSCSPNQVLQTTILSIGLRLKIENFKNKYLVKNNDQKKLHELNFKCCSSVKKTLQILNFKLTMKLF